MPDMVTIREQDLIDSVADALQFISFYHPMDYIRALGEAYEAEQGPAAKDAIKQILVNNPATLYGFNLQESRTCSSRGVS